VPLRSDHFSNINKILVYVTDFIHSLVVASASRSIRHKLVYLLALSARSDAARLCGVEFSQASQF
jgi:hypothetical protein